MVAKGKLEISLITFLKITMQKKERIEIRLSKIDKLILIKKASKAGLSLSQYVLSCSLNLEIKNRLALFLAAHNPSCCALQRRLATVGPLSAMLPSALCPACRARLPIASK